MKLFALKQRGFYDALLLFLASAFLMYFYGPVLMAPNEFLFTKYGDGFTQYFNFISYVKHGQNYFEHALANYPYGEQIVYFDAQPFFALVTKLLVEVYPDLEHYSIGIMNGLALFAIWWTPFLIYRILVRVDVHPLVAVWGAMGILFLEPQIFRLTGHFSLSYCCAIPLTIYLLLRIYEQHRVVFWMLLLFFNNLVWLYTHPYLGLMCCVLTGMTFFVYWCHNIKVVATRLKYYILGFISSILPLVIFQVVTKLTDSHHSKTEDVYGMFEYCGEPEDVFLPNHPPFKQTTEEWLGYNLEQTWEGWSYIGILTIVILFLAILVGGYKRLRGTHSKGLDATHPAIKILLWASLPILFLSWAYPFVQYPELLDYLKIIKQFRSLGRFAWVFYYASTIATIYYLDRAILFLRNKNQNFLAILLLILAPILYLIEGYSAHEEVSKSIDRYPNYFLEENCPEVLTDALQQINPSDYQAIIPLPYYYIGSGNFCRTILGGTTHFSMLTSVYTGLPMATACVARGDVWDSRNLVQLFTAPYYDKKIKSDFPSKKPFLITKSNYIEPLTVYEQEVFDRAQLISIDKEGYALYSLEYEELFRQQNNTVLATFEKKKSFLHSKGTWLVEDSTATVFYEDFETQNSTKALRGTGAFNAPKTGSGTFVTMPLEKQDKSRVYQIKTWVFNGEIDAMNHLQIMAFGANNKGDWKQLGQSRPDRSPVIYGDWSLVEFSVTIPPNQLKTLRLDYYCGIKSKRRVYIDEVVIYSGDGAVYKVVQEKNNRVEELIYNGHKVLRKE